MPIDAPIDPLTNLSAARFGLYIHFPYCLARCPYCDFAVTVAREIPEKRYADAILRELDLRIAEWPELRGRRLDSIFFGGGTPSLWQAEHVERVIEGVRSRFDLSPTAEISLEANPEVADAGRYEGYRRAGVNRLSLGVQSFDERTLRSLGRAHDAAQAERAFHIARAAGFDVVSMDFIYGVQGQSVEQVRADAERAASLRPDHVSAYALTVERDVLAVETTLSRQLRKGELTLPEESELVEMANAVVQGFEGAGLQRYETSNFARAGLHSRHNALYWTGGEYLAAGVGAVGLVHGVRYTNQRGTEHYLSSVEAGTN
ncbi:MAG: radical SAM family heme chaperone HemW, partial [Myxococcaceae bacterium]